MAITQYNEYGTISTQIQNIVANNVGLLDDYILMQTGEYEYTALIKDNATKDVTQIKITRNSGNYSSQYTVTKTDVEEFKYTVNNEYYVYSNQQLGQSLNCPIYEQATSYAVVIICCVLCLAIVFKGVLFKCLDKLKRRF